MAKAHVSVCLFQIPVLNIQMKIIPAIFTLLGAVFSCTSYFRVIFTGGMGKNGSTIAVSLILILKGMLLLLYFLVSWLHLCDDDVKKIIHQNRSLFSIAPWCSSDVHMGEQGSAWVLWLICSYTGPYTVSCHALCVLTHFVHNQHEHFGSLCYCISSLGPDGLVRHWALGTYNPVVGSPVVLSLTT